MHAYVTHITNITLSSRINKEKVKKKNEMTK